MCSIRQSYSDECSTISGEIGPSQYEHYVKGLSVIIRPSGNERAYDTIKGTALILPRKIGSYCMSRSSYYYTSFPSISYIAYSMIGVAIVAKQGPSKLRGKGQILTAPCRKHLGWITHEAGETR